MHLSSNLSTYFLEVVLPRRVIMEPTQYGTMIFWPKPSQNFPVFHCWTPAFRIVGFLGCSPNVYFSWCREQVKDDSSEHITRAFPVAWCTGFIVETPPHTDPSITFRNQRFSNCSPTVDIRFVKLGSDSFYWNRDFKINIQFWCHLCWVGCVIFRNNPSQCTTISLFQC
jgi:hypothetical protein